MTPKAERLKAEVAGLVDRGCNARQIATMLRLPLDRVEDILDDLEMAGPSVPNKPGPKPVERPTSAHELHYLWWASLSRAKAQWLSDHGLLEAFWQASADARTFERCARMAAS